VTRGRDGKLNRSWLFRFATWKIKINEATGKRRREERMAGLGPFPAVSLAAAREKAAEARTQRAQGIDPIEAKRALQASDAIASAKVMTFDQCRDGYIASHQTAWSPRHAQLWKRSLELHVRFGRLPVAAIDTAVVMKDLEPLWSTIPDIAARVRGRIEAVLDWARVRGFRSGENPARWKGHLDHLLPARFKVRAVEHFAALPYTKVSSFVRKLREQQGTAARSLEFLILTACRTNEVIGACWSEINVEAQVWTVPPERSKTRKEHRVPLSDTAVAIIKRQAKVRENEFVFPGQLRHGLSQMALVKLLRRMGLNDITVHGFRSTFRDWAAETTYYPNHVVEMALGHTVGSKVEAAYRRGDLFEKRRRLMTAWAEYCAKTAASGEVVPLRKEVPG
jgi:integrase